MDQKQIDEIKKANPDCTVVEFNDGKVAVFSKPTRAVIGLTALNNRDNGPLSAIDTLLSNCWLAGDEIVKTDPGYAIGLMRLMDDLTGSKIANLKK